MKSILDGVAVGTTERADAHDLVVAEADKKFTWALPENCNSGSSYTCRPTCDWLDDCPTGGSSTQDHNWVQDLKHLLGDGANTEEGKTIL